MATPKKKPAQKKSVAKKSAPKKTAAKKTAAKPKAATAAEIAAWRAVSQSLDIRVEILTGDGIQTVAGNTPVPVGTWFAAVPVQPSSRRYHYVLQWRGKEKKFVLAHLVDGAGATRLPPAGGWSRAFESGSIHVLASDLLLTRPQIAQLIGGHEGSTGTAKPPYT